MPLKTTASSMTCDVSSSLVSTTSTFTSINQPQPHQPRPSLRHQRENKDEKMKYKHQLLNITISHKIFEYFIVLIPKKVELLIRFFEPFWISRVFHFFLRTFEKVEPHPGPLEPPDETYAQSKFDISGSNETMQNALAPLVLANF